VISGDDTYARSDIAITADADRRITASDKHLVPDKRVSANRQLSGGSDPDGGKQLRGRINIHSA
jgi:hypothetical protein